MVQIEPSIANYQIIIKKKKKKKKPWLHPQVQDFDQVCKRPPPPINVVKLIVDVAVTNTYTNLSIIAPNARGR